MLQMKIIINAPNYLLRILANENHYQCTKISTIIKKIILVLLPKETKGIIHQHNVNNYSHNNIHYLNMRGSLIGVMHHKDNTLFD